MNIVGRFNKRMFEKSNEEKNIQLNHPFHSTDKYRAEYGTIHSTGCGMYGYFKKILC